MIVIICILVLFVLLLFVVGFWVLDDACLSFEFSDICFDDFEVQEDIDGEEEVDEDGLVVIEFMIMFDGEIIMY